MIIAVGVAHAVNNASADEIINHMIEAAEACEARLEPHAPRKGRMSEYMRKANKQPFQALIPQNYSAQNYMLRLPIMVAGKDILLGKL